MDTTHAYDTLRGHHRPHPHTAGAGHGALAQALGERDGHASQPFQSALLSRHQRLAAHGHGLCLPILGDVPAGQNRWGERPQGRARSPRGVLEGLYTTTTPRPARREKRFVLRQYTVFNAAQLDGVAIPDDHRPRAPLHAHRAVCPAGGRHAATARRSSTGISARFTSPRPIRCICRARRASRAQKPITPRSFMN